MSQKQNPLTADALDFAPGLLSIQESPPARLPRAVMYSVSGLLAILLLWACFGKLDIIASADGKLVPQSYVKIVQPADAGIVQEILVREGEQVQAGQVLLRMDAKESEADTQTLRAQLALRSLQLRRIDAELSGGGLLRRNDDPTDLFRQVQAQFRDRRQAYLDALAQAQEMERRARHDHEAGAEVLAKLEQTNPILRSQADAFSNLGKDGYAPQVMVGDKQRAYLENEQDLRAQRSTVAGLSAAMTQASRQVATVTSRYRSELQNERIEAQSEFEKLQQQLAKQTHRSGLLELKAPHPGVIKDLATHTVGTVVSAGTILLSIVPENEPLVAEVMVRNEDVGFVHAEQKVRMKLAAYPFQKYGMLDGVVLQVWPDTSSDESSSSQEDGSRKRSEPGMAPYKALIALSGQTLQAQGNTLKLVAGMQVVAEINQGRRTVLEYLLSPIQKTLDESGRER